VTIAQRAGEIVGLATRFSSLNLWHEGMSYTRAGVRLPAVRNPSEAFLLLFVDQTPAELASMRASIAGSDSILDAVLNETKSLQMNLGKDDREKLEEYFNSIRETERKLQISDDWLDKPKSTTKDPSMKGVGGGALPWLGKTEQGGTAQRDRSHSLFTGLSLFARARGVA
jgi:hypothetical protein